MKDFTTGNIKKHFLIFLIPLILRNIVSQLYTFVDTAIVGHFFGKKALSATGSIFPILFVFMSIIIGFFVGVTSTTAKFFGKKDFQSLQKLTHTTINFTIIFGALLTFFTITFSQQIINLLQLPTEIKPMAISYYKALMIGNIFMIAFYGFTNIFQGLGESKTPMYLSIAFSLLNIFGDILLGVILKGGVVGVGLSTSISFAIVFFAAVYLFHRKISFFKIKLKFSMDLAILKEISRIGLPVFMQMAFISSNYLVQQILINRFGTLFIAAISVGVKITSIYTTIGITFANGLTPTVGQNFAKKLHCRIKTLINISLKYLLIFSIFSVVLINIFPETFARIFTNEKDVIQIVIKYLHIVSPSYLFIAINFIINGFFRGIGKTKYPMYGSAIALWFIKLPLIILFSYSVSFSPFKLLPMYPERMFYAFALGTMAEMTINSILFMRINKKYKCRLSS